MNTKNSISQVSQVITTVLEDLLQKLDLDSSKTELVRKSLERLADIASIYPQT
jgi:hypothetical protein